jgi:hypothetical protein
VVNLNFGKTNYCVSSWFTLHLPYFLFLACSLSYLSIYSGVSVCEVQALNIPHRTSLRTTHPACVFFKQANKKEDRGESLPSKPCGFGLAKPVAPVGVVLHFRCVGA